MIDQSTLTLLFNTQYNLSYDNFLTIFGASASHLWQRFAEAYNYNLLGFFHYLDGNNKEKLCKYINDEI